MIKRVNFTGRRRIARDQIEIEVFDGSPRTFDAHFRLDDSKLPPHADVILEAMCAGSNVVERFECGPLADLKSVRRRPLLELEGENVFFTLKVVDRAEQVGFGRILGIAENLRPDRSGKQTAAGRRGILPIEPTDLGEEIWRLDFRDHDVYLLVNQGVPGLVDRARSDASFYAVAYPEIVRRILGEAFDVGGDPNEDDDKWQTLWLRFGEGLHPSAEKAPIEPDLVDDREDWIDEVVCAFCDSHALKTKFVEAMPEGNGGEA